ncbi:methylated-DNA--[protein]-cysteine S-methyltransferase [Corynebacterium sp. MC3]|uniref:methylated-DNA--[protein]-cysteine S-methyltransferase n=1 Tax=Corynebacterium sp. MC3 TaxID=1720193 RepID=UPI0008DA9E7B|nr:methylated-DNA--[protein]-cysteine S-methyltransferase [Corynebacterium sp. MC3]
MCETSFATVETQVGTLTVVVSPRGVRRISLPTDDPAEVIHATGARPGPIGAIRGQLEEYFAGTRTSFDVPLDLEGFPPFRTKVLGALQHVPFGETITYKELAADVDNPGAVRAVGTACAKNPLPLLIPCHRVVRSDGHLGRYRGGEDMKRFLLALEGHHERFQ